jgi:plasmid replication initiation protein
MHVLIFHSLCFGVMNYVIMPAIEDINQFSNINVTLQHIKTGREITHFSFKYSFKKTEKREIETKKITRKYIEKHA